MQHILEKVMSMQHSFEGFSEKQRRVGLKFVGNFVASPVLVESANHFSLERCEGHSTALNIFRSHIVNQTVWKNLKDGFILLMYEVWGRIKM